jgi:MscS family membrane protein
MCANRAWKAVPSAALILCGLAAAVTAQPAQPPAKAAPVLISARQPREFLTSPRETLKTLYYAVVAYDFQPKLIDEAIACLDLDLGRADDPAEGARLAIDLEQVLRILCIPIHGVPEKTDVETGAVTVHKDKDFHIAMARGPDGLWRFDRATVERIPAMARASLAHFRDLQAERARLVDDCTDPSATMRRILIAAFTQDFYAAAGALDLSGLPQEERADKGPILARQLAFVVQRRGWVFLQEVPNHPSGPPCTWHADRAGRIALERVRQEDGKEAWLFSKKTVRNIPAMYALARDLPVDPRFVRLGAALAPLAEDDHGSSKRAPAGVPAQVGSPRALLQGFFRVMDAAETQDSRLVEALQFLDLRGIPQADVRVQGVKLASKLEAVLRKIRVELSALPDDWNAPPQVLGAGQGVRVELVRLRDGWRFSQTTVNQAPALLDKLSSKEKEEHDRAASLDSARDTMSTFLRCIRRGEYEQAAECLDLSHCRTATQDLVGPSLAYKLKFVIDRIGRVYIQEVPDTADGPRYVFYRGELGRIVIARKGSGARKGSWLFTPQTVALIEPMFRSVINQPVSEASRDGALPPPRFLRSPGLWIRFWVPERLRGIFWKLQAYQWIGLALAIALCVLVPRLLLAEVYVLVALILRKSGSVLTRSFVASRLRPLTWVVAWWLFFQLVGLLDLPLRLLDSMVPLKIFGLAGLVALFGVRFVDLVTAVYTNSELLRPHRSLSDMVVPVSMRLLKGGILLLVAVYLIYQVGEGDSLSRFLTGLGVAGLAASLAAQDALKSFFSTLLLIGERSFKIGDHIAVGDLEGVVEQVGFRATRLRTSDGSLLTVPNSTITAGPIDNLSTRAFTRCKASLLVNYDTATEHILALRDSLRSWLRAHPKVRPDKVEVSVNRLTEQGVEVTVDLYLADSNGGGEKELKEEINCELLRLCKNLEQEQRLLHPLSGGEKTKEGATLHRAA